MSRHTPGPWKVVEINGGGFSIDSDLFSICDTCQDVTDECDLANARLIAAAPDLLKALKACQDYFYYADGPSSFKREYESACAAIAKAEDGAA